MQTNMAEDQSDGPESLDQQESVPESVGNVNVESIKSLESELKQLKQQLHQIEDAIRQKNQQLTMLMARSVSAADIDDILALDHDDSWQRSISSVSAESKDDENEELLIPKAKAIKKKKKKGKVLDQQQKAKLIWSELEKQITAGNIAYVKKRMQSNTVKLNDNTQWNGKTMLMMAAEQGEYDMCAMLINLGANVATHNKYGTRDASFYANKMGHYHILRLLLITSFGGEASAKIGDMLKRMDHQRAMNAALVARVTADPKSYAWMEGMVAYVCHLVRSKQIFSDDMLNMAWHFTVHSVGDVFDKALQSELWQTIMQSCRRVLESRDGNDWFWFKSFMLKSTIWLNGWHRELDEAAEDVDRLLIKFLFDIAKQQSSQNSTALTSMRQKFDADWADLMRFDLATAYGEAPRQDVIANGLTTKYSKAELSHSPAFNALHFYDIHQYLPHLILLGHFYDDAFQRDVQRAFAINGTTHTNVAMDIKYRRGPIKDIARCRVKAENDYKRCEFPSSAHCLDVIRCMLTFYDVRHMLQSLASFAAQIQQQECGVIRDIVRVKNGFREDWDEAQPNYADLKLNVLVQNDAEYAMIAEMQFLLHDMSEFKLSSHKLYGILRLEEEISNLLKIKPMVMNHEKRLRNASYFNDANEVAYSMVVHQQPIAFIAERMRLKTVLANNGLKLLRTLTRYMSKTSLRQQLKQCAGFQLVCAKGLMSMIQFLYAEIIPADIQNRSYDEMMKSGLYEVINNGYFEILQWMFCEDQKFGHCKFLGFWHDTDIGSKHEFFRTVCGLGQTDCAKLLRAHFKKDDWFDVNQQSVYGYRAMTKAIRAQQIDTIRWLLSLPGIDCINENENKGKIMLWEALDAGNMEIGDLLLDTFVNVQKKEARKMLTYKANLGNTIRMFVMSAGRKGSKKHEAIAAVKKWAEQYKVVELQIIQFDGQNVKY